MLVMAPPTVPVVDGKKVCSRCGENRPVQNFFKSNTTRSGYTSACKDCTRDDRAAHGRNMRLREYGITVEEYFVLLEKQDGMCALCGKAAEDCAWGVLDVDHCHATGKVRGLLCNSCNQGLGMFKDDPDLLEYAAAYIREGKDA